MIKPLILFLSILFFTFCDIYAQDTLAYWSFNEAVGNNFNEAIGNSPFKASSVRNVVEHVNGVSGNAFRTDGYSSFVQGDLVNTLPTNIISISGWLALESYPNATASVWSKIQSSTVKGLEINITKFGLLQVNFYVNGIKNSLTTSNAVSHAIWNFLTVSINASKGTAKLYLNGIPKDSSSYNAGPLLWPTSSILIGKSYPDSIFGNIFPKNFLNGIIDEFVIWKKELNDQQVLQIYNRQNPTTKPDLTVPASRFAGDFHRPMNHAIPQANWTNESHGFIYYNGLYHLFSQRNPNGPYLDQINWAHYISKDLLNWKEQTVVLWPEPGYDQVGVWAGHLVLNNNIPTIVYPGVNGMIASICSAVSIDSMQSFQKNKSNPLIPQSPASFPNNDFRDPYVFKENGSWYMIIGSGLRTSPQKGCVFLYKSADLENWQLLGPMFTGNPSVDNSGVFWEVPVFWKFGSKYVLLVNKVSQPNIPARTLYWVGNFVNERFFPDNPKPKSLELINVLLSPSVNLDEFGNVTALGIVPDLLPSSENYQKGWAHLFSYPRIWSLSGDTLLVQSPHPNLKKLRGAKKDFNNITLTDSTTNYFSGIGGHQLEIEVNINPGTEKQVGFILGKSADGSEQTRIYYDYGISQIVVDRTKSSTNSNANLDFMSEPFKLDPSRKTKWRIYTDGSVIDVFVNDSAAFSTRMFPVSVNSKFIDMFVTGGSATIDSASVWDLGNNLVTSLNIPPSILLSDKIKIWPNPFQKELNFGIDLDQTKKVEIGIFDLLGNKVKTISEMLRRGHNELKWNGISDEGKIPLSGIYFVKIDSKSTIFRGEKIIKE